MAKKSKPAISQQKHKENVFFGVMMIIPCLHWILWYAVLNANSLALAFRKYDFEADRYVFAGLSNFKDVIKTFVSDPSMWRIGINSLIVYAVGLSVTLLLTIFFSFYLYKKFPLHGFFKFVLYFPSMISSIVVVLIFTYFVERFIPGLAQNIWGVEMQGFLSNPDTRFGTIVFYGIWIGFGGSMLYFLGSMNAIDPQMVEAAQIDGVSLFQEFRYITLPMIYPTLTTTIVTGIVGIFTNQNNLIPFYGTNAPSNLQTIGYWLFADTLKAEETRYPFLSAAGLLITLIVAPITFLVRHLMEKYGPSTEA